MVRRIARRQRWFSNLDSVPVSEGIGEIEEVTTFYGCEDWILENPALAEFYLMRTHVPLLRTADVKRLTISR